MSNMGAVEGPVRPYQWPDLKKDSTWRFAEWFLDSYLGTSPSIYDGTGPRRKIPMALSGSIR
jgi:hypothetical protein